MTISKEKADYIISLAEDNGYISPTRLVEEASNPNSPLHTDFEWDDRAAAGQHRLEQARALIRFVKVNVQIKSTMVIAPYYVPDPERPQHSRRYVELTVAGRNQEMARQVLLAELERIASAIRRAQQIAQVLGLSDELEALLDDVASIKTATERRQEEKRAAKVMRKRKPPRGGEGRARPA